MNSHQTNRMAACYTCAAFLTLTACQSPTNNGNAPTPRQAETTLASPPKPQPPSAAPTAPHKEGTLLPAASFDRVSAYIQSLRPPLDLESLLSGFGAASALDPSSPCSKALYSAVAKLMRNHETMVLRPNGTDLYYYKDQYRVFFFEKGIAELNKTPDISFGDFSRLPNPGREIYPRWRSVAIISNARCDSAFVRVLNYGNNTNYKKHASMSVAKITSNFLKNPDKGTVTSQFYKDGFTGNSGTIKDFAYSCDEDTCRKL